MGDILLDINQDAAQAASIAALQAVAPTADQKAALAGTSGTAPSASNKLVDSADTRLPRTVTHAATADLSAADVSNTVITNYGQSGIATLTLPTAAANMNFVIIVGTTGNALHVKAGANDKVYLDGTALDDADKVSLAVPALGNCAAFFAFQTGVSAWDWFCNTIAGNWTDGGA